MFGFTHIQELVSSPPPFTLKSRPKGAKTKAVFLYFRIFLILFWFFCQTFGGVIKLDCCLWALRGKAQILKLVYNSTFLILVPNINIHNKYCSIFGFLESRFLSISKICVQFNILDSILIFLPNIWVSYQVGLLSLGPVGPWEGRAQFLKCVYNSTFLIFENFRKKVRGKMFNLNYWGSITLGIIFGFNCARRCGRESWWFKTLGGLVIL